MHLIKHELDLKLVFDSHCDRGKVQMVLDVTLHNPSPLTGSRCPSLPPRSFLTILFRLSCAIWFLMQRRARPNIAMAFGKQERTKAPWVLLACLNVQLYSADPLQVSLLPFSMDNQSLSPLQNLLMLVFAKLHAQIAPCFISSYIQVDKLLWNESIVGCETTERYSRRKKESARGRQRPGH